MANQYAQWCNDTITCESVPHEYWLPLPTEVFHHVDLSPYYRVSGGDHRKAQPCTASPAVYPPTPSSALA